jgi:hypothetical protein
LPSINLCLFAFYSQRKRTSCKKRAKRLLLYGGDGASEIGAPTKRHVACRLKESTTQILSLSAPLNHTGCAPPAAAMRQISKADLAVEKGQMARLVGCSHESWPLICNFICTHSATLKLNQCSLQDFAQRTHSLQFLSILRLLFMGEPKTLVALFTSM